MPEQWRYDPGPLYWGNDYLPPKLVEVFPDVSKTVIYRTLLKQGIDAEKLEVVYDWTAESVMGTGYTDSYVIYVNDRVIERHYPGNWKYVGLVHELAHVLQREQGRPADLTLEEEFGDRPDWEEQPKEVDAIYWSALQASRMGLSKEDFAAQMRARYGPTQETELYDIDRIVGGGYAAMDRRPVRRHKRRA